MMIDFIFDHWKAFLAASVALVVALCASYVIALRHSERTVTATVTKTWVSSGGNSHTNFIGTNKGVFEDSDSLLYGKFNSSDFFNNMQVGKTYTFQVIGWRIPFASDYPNIVSCQNC